MAGRIASIGSVFRYVLWLFSDVFDITFLQEKYSSLRMLHRHLSIPSMTLLCCHLATPAEVEIRWNSS